MSHTDVEQAEIRALWFSGLNFSQFFSALEKYGIYRFRTDYVAAKSMLYTSTELVISFDDMGIPLAGTYQFDIEQIIQIHANSNLTYMERHEGFVRAGAVAHDFYKNGNRVLTGPWGESHTTQFAVEEEEEEESNEDYLERREAEIRAELEGNYKENKKDMKRKLEREYRDKDRRRR
jgi:hypothetical protein